MNKQTLILLFTFIVGVLASGARAANYIWDGGYTSGNNWNSANNWNPDSAPTAPGTGTHTIQFAGSTRTSPNVSVSYNIYSITFNSGAAAFNVTWSGGTLTIQGGGVVNNDDTLQTITAPITMGAAQTWNAASGGLTFGGAITKASKLLTITGGNSTTINGILTGSGGLTKEGGGDLILNPSASACAIGTITVNSGRLFIFNANAIANSAILDVSSGATLDFGITGGATSANTMTFDSGSCLANRVGTLTLTGTTTFPSVGTMIFNQDDAATTAITINRAPFVALTGDLTIQVGSNNVTVGSVTLAGAINGAGGLSKTSCGTLILGGANSYSGDTTISGGTLALASGGSLNVASSVNIAAGTTFDVSAKATPYTWGASASLVASGNGATVGTTAATIKGPSSGTVSMGSRPIVLTFTPAAFTGDTTHPSLYISQGTLSLNGNAFTVNNAAATPLGIGTYRLIQQASGNITSAGSYSVAVTGTGLAAGTTASIQVSLGNVNLVVTKPTPAFFNLTASQAITYGTTSVTLGGTLSAGAVYPAAGETVSITINGSSQNATIAGGAGGFSVSFPAESIPYSASAYTITYAYAGSVNLNPAPNDTSTALTVNKRSLTVTATGVNKGYDGNVTATVTLADNRVSGDVLTLSNTSATFNNKNVGTTKTVSVSG
ncbi:MAG: YDG domain-containing protein, partial [bacterium]